MKKQDFNQKTEKELRDSLIEFRSKLRSLRFDLKLAKLQNTCVIQHTKRDIARIMTILRQKHGETISKTE